MLVDFCQKLGMPENATKQICKYQGFAQSELVSGNTHHLLSSETAEASWTSLQEKCKEKSHDGFAELAVMLTAAELAQQKYSKKGISETIYWDTMKCFSRFVEESFGWNAFYSWDRGSWAWRQLCGNLFRIGNLEFEIVPLGTDLAERLKTSASGYAISVHIPSNAILRRADICASYAQFKNLHSFLWPNLKIETTYCTTWLLSPIVHSVLSATSGIRCFADDFTITSVDYASNAAFLWIFGKKSDTPYELLPEKTSLQRGAKEILSSGRKLGEATGVLNF